MLSRPPQLIYGRLSAALGIASSAATIDARQADIDQVNVHHSLVVDPAKHHDPNKILVSEACCSTISRPIPTICLSEIVMYFRAQG
jgi:hypothetical protein